MSEGGTVTRIEVATRNPDLFIYRLKLSMMRRAQPAAWNIFASRRWKREIAMLERLIEIEEWWDRFLDGVARLGNVCAGVASAASDE